MEDTQVRAPLKGTIIQKNVELGTVISSPTKDVGGGTVLLRMANLDTVQVSALVDETDVGKVQPGIPVTITVDAYPTRQFDGQVLKIEPQAQVNQNVTMFPVLVNIPTPGSAPQKIRSRELGPPRPRSRPRAAASSRCPRA